MSLSRHKHWDIQRRILILVVVPLALVTALLATYFIRSGQSAVHDLFIQEGKDISRYLAKVTEFYVFSGDEETLKSISTLLVRENDVLSVTFFDADKSISTHVGSLQPSALKPLPWQQEATHWYFQQVIEYSTLDVDDFPTSDPGTQEAGSTKTLGWVQVVLSAQFLVEKQRQILVTGTAIALIGLLIASAMALRLSRGITRPIFKLADTVEELEAGNLSARAPAVRGHEFQILAQGLNRMAERIENSNEELHQRVQQATQQLSHTLDNLAQKNLTLEETQGDLIRADQAKDEFLARISHELRTPLTSIIGYSELMEETGLSPQQTEFNRVVVQSSDLLLSIINDILDLTKLRSDAVELEHLPFNLEDCLEDVVAMHAHRAFEKGLELILLIETDVPLHVRGDALRLSQIVNNLLSNAIKFTEQGEVVVSLSCTFTAGRDFTLNIQVKDSGIGIREEDLPNLFQEFSQADSSITRRFGGSGLGLVIVKRLANLMGGDISLASKLGSGVEAKCQVRLEADNDALVLEPQTPQIKSVIIYDQNAWSQRAWRKLAFSASRNITNVKSTNALLSRLQKHSAQAGLIIVGLSQREWNRATLIKLLKDIRRASESPLLLAASATRVQFDRLLPNHQDFAPIEFISKPSRRALFSEQVNKLLSPAKPEQSAPQRKQELKPQQKPLIGQDVIIAEDNEFNRDYLVQLLETLGARVRGAANGRQALDEYQAAPTDILILDINMPEMDGYEAAQRIRGLAATKPPLVVALTAGLLPESANAESHAGLFDAILEKPIRPEQLATALAQLLAKRSDAQNQATTKSQPLIRISPEALYAELNRLMSLIESHLDQNQTSSIKTYAHQMAGIIDKQQFPKTAALIRSIERECEIKRIEELQKQLEALKESLATDFNNVFNSH